MPDTIVPVVRRPVRRSTTTPPNTTAAQEKQVGPDPATAPRKLSLGGEPHGEDNPPRLRRTPPRSSGYGRPSPTPAPSKPRSPDPAPGNCFPATPRENLPSMPVARNRPIKTSVSICPVYCGVSAGLVFMSTVELVF